jgi:putative transposase
LRKKHQTQSCAEAMLDKEALQVALGKVLTTDQKREAVMLMCDATGLSQRRACWLTGLSCRLPL